MDSKMSTKYQHICVQCVKYSGRISKNQGKGRHMDEHTQAVTLEMCTFTTK